MQLQLIQNRIYEIRGEKVMLDFDLAQLYEVETRVFNQAVKRNVESFPKDFMFKLTKLEWEDLKSSQVEMSSHANLTSQNVISSSAYKSENWGGRRNLPYAFTEHGVTMLASTLKSIKARKMNIAIVRAFIALKKAVLLSNEMFKFVKELKERLDDHDVQLGSIYDAIENLLNDKISKKTWEERERIGFKKKD